MPGLTGVVGVSEGASAAALDMARSLGRGLSEEKVLVAGNSCEAMASEAFPARSPKQNVFLASDGSITGINGEISGLSDDGCCSEETFTSSDRAHPARLLSDLYRRQGLAVIPRLRGAFSIAIWDAPAKTLHLASDRYGLRPMYYSILTGSVAFSSEVKALLRVLPSPRSLDEQGIADFLFLGMPIGARTFFSNVHLLPPATIVSVHEARVTQRRYWNLSFRPSDEPCNNIERAAELFAEAFSRAVHDCTSDIDPIELPLSGGLDSRCLAVAAHPSKSIRTYTIGSEGSEDLRIGPHISRILGLPNAAWTLTASDFLDWIPKTIFLTDGMYSPLHSPIIYIAERLPTDASVVLDGANSFSGSYMFPYVLFGRFLHLRWDPVRCFLKICSEPIAGPDGKFFPAPFAEEYAERAESFLRATIDEVQSTIPNDHKETMFDALDYLKQRNRVPRYNMMGCVILRGFCEVRHPLFDPRVIDVVTTFAPLLRTKEKYVFGRYLRRTAPALADVVYERTGLPADSGMARHAIHYAVAVLERGMGHLVPRLKPKPRTAIDFVSFVQKDAELRAFLRDMFLSDCRDLAGYFSPEGLERLWSALVNGRHAHLPFIMRIITLKLWAEFFLHDGARPEFRS